MSSSENIIGIPVNTGLVDLVWDIALLSEKVSYLVDEILTPYINPLFYVNITLILKNIEDLKFYFILY